MSNLIFLFCIARTGSNNLCSLLNNSHNIIYNTEDFNGKLGVKYMKSNIKKYIIEKSNINETNLDKFLSNNPKRYLKILSDFKVDKYKLLKIFDTHLPIKKILNILGKFISSKKIILKRNLLEVYLSKKIAEKTKKWYNYNTSFIKIRINFIDFIKFYIKWNRYYNILEKYKDKNTIVLNYKDFCRVSKLEQYNFLKKNLDKINIKLDIKDKINSNFIKQSKLPIEEQIINYKQIKYLSNIYKLKID